MLVTYSYSCMYFHNYLPYTCSLNLQDLAELDNATVFKLREAALMTLTKNEVSLLQFMETVASKIPDKWYSVGIALGLTKAQLNAINIHHCGDPCLCFSDVHDHWQRHSTSQQPANWASLATTLRCDIVGENALAELIQEKFM